MKKLLVCISYHYSEDRFQYISKVIENLLSYPMDVDIIIDTNEENDSLKLYENQVRIKVHKNLSHPYQLTYMHRLSIYSELDNYDYFMYCEDDMLVPFENFEEYLKNFKMLFPLNYVPSFIRVETNEGKEYVTDLIGEQDDLFAIKCDSKTFAQLKQPYHAFWIMPKEELKETMTEVFTMVGINRELASSYPMWQLKKIPLVLVEGDRISPLCYSYHLPNNYATDPNHPHGKIELSNLTLKLKPQNKMEKILNKLKFNIGVPSDINEHLITLFDYGRHCKHITEMGVRAVCSTWAFLFARPDKMISYDILRNDNINEPINLAKEYEIDYTFIEADVLKVEIEPTELLFIDTFHTYNQLIKELNLHAEKVSKYIIFHDTVTFGEIDESIQPNYVLSDKILNEPKEKQGLIQAINDFLSSEKGKDWVFEKIYLNNNGLTIIKRK